MLNFALTLIYNKIDFNVQNYHLISAKVSG